MTCREFTDFILDYLDGLLAAANRARFEEHLANCPECRTFLDSYRRSGRLAKDALRPREPVRAPEELIRAILDSGERS